MRRLKFAAGGFLVVLGAAQIFQPERANPPADPAASFEAVAKPAPQTAAVLARACRDCHSHETEWPWYSRVSPVSWLIANDVRNGRAHLNLSQWNLYSPEMSGIRMREICGEVRAGKMPPRYYTPLHPAARLSAKDVAAVCSANGSPL